MTDSAIVRRSGGRKVDKLSGRILNTLRSSPRPLATQEIADKLGKPWHSIQNRCLRLQVESKINGFRVGRINLWQVL